MVGEHGSIELQRWLPRFFTDYQDCRTSTPLFALKPKPTPVKLDVSKLTHWFAAMGQPMIDARKGAFQFDPWEVAGLGRDEVRNSAVLAWLLNPKGSHGLGDVAMSGLLGDLRHFDNAFPSTCGNSCRVRVESNPDGDIGNRVDIEIDDEYFYVIIEVKVDAPEGEKQMERYGDIASKLAGSRPWALVFLTPQGRESNTAGPYIDHVFRRSWRQLSFSVAQSAKARSFDPLEAGGPARQMAEQSVRCFLKKMQKF